MSRLEKRLLNLVARANREFNLVEPRDRVMVCLSGGKDSYVLMHLLAEVQRRVPFEVELIAVNLDQQQPGFPQHRIEEWCKERGFAHRMLERDTYSVVLDKIPEGKTYCSLCSRLRRGILYEAAVEMGATKIALGHHRDDVIETLMLNLLYAGQIKAMPPRLLSDDGRNTIIRPLVYCAEEDIAAFAEEMGFPVVPCGLCGSQPTQYRQRVKGLLSMLEADNPKIKGNLLAALSNVRVSHLMDRDLTERLG
jgi:tRNA 2-thiocytidine biosynthesis protein TtcA